MEFIREKCYFKLILLRICTNPGLCWHVTKVHKSAHCIWNWNGGARTIYSSNTTYSDVSTAMGISNISCRDGTITRSCHSLSYAILDYMGCVVYNKPKSNKFLFFVYFKAPPLERARLHGIAVSGAFVGTVVGLPLSGLLADYAGWEYIFYVIGAISLVWYIIWLISIRSSPENDSFISKYERNYIACTIGKQKEKISHPIPWLSILRSLPIHGVLIASLGWGWGYVTMLTQLPQFLFDVMNFDLSKSGFLSALPYLTMTIMSLIAGYIADFILVRQLLTVTRLRKYFISFTMVFQAAFIVIAAYVDHPTANIICITAGIGMGALAYSGIGINYIDVAPEFAAVIGGLGNTLTTLPGIVSPLITGIVVQVNCVNNKNSLMSKFMNLNHKRLW